MGVAHVVAPTADRPYEVHVPPSYSASVAAPAPVARRDLGSLADFETRWNVAVSRDGKVPKIGDVVLEITRAAPPCRTIAPSFTGGAFVRISDKVHPGWSRLYARVLREGFVRDGAPVRLL